MCVICFKPKGIKVPAKEELEKMFSKNKDGAGFAYDLGNGKIHYEKGFMTFDDFYSALKKQKLTRLKKTALGIHFRITTHGKTDAQTTHPFPITDKFSEMRKLQGEGKMNVLFHNGTFAGLGGIINKNSSDTQDFVAGPAFLLMNNLRKATPIKRKMFENEMGISSRVLIMRGNKKAELYGDWRDHKNGCKFSNLLWETSIPSATCVSGCSSTATWGPGQNPNKTELRENELKRVHSKEIEAGMSIGTIHSRTEWAMYLSPEKLGESLKHYNIKKTENGAEEITTNWLDKVYYKKGDKMLATKEGEEKIEKFLKDNKVAEFDHNAGIIAYLANNPLQMTFAELLDYFTHTDEGTLVHKGNTYFIDNELEMLMEEKELYKFYAPVSPEKIKEDMLMYYSTAMIEEDDIFNDMREM